MRKSFHVSILSSESKIYEGPAVSLTVPAGLGEMGVWADHMPYLTTLRPGRIVLKVSEEQPPVVYRSTGKGFCDILRSRVTLLLDEVKPSHDTAAYGGVQIGIRAQDERAGTVRHPEVGLRPADASCVRPCAVTQTSSSRGLGPPGSTPLDSKKGAG